MDRPIDPVLRRKQIGRRAITAALLGAAVVVVLVWGPAWIAPTVSRSRIRTAAVEVGPIEATISSSGTVVPEVEQVISSPVDATVLRILKKPGVVVSKGDPILELDVSGSVLELEKAAQNIALKENQQRKTKIELEKTLTDLQSQWDIKSLELQSFRSQVHRNRKLFEDGLLSEEVLRQSELQEAKTDLELRQLALELDALKVGESRVIPILGRRRVKCSKSEFLDRGFARQFLMIEELTEELRLSEKAAYEKLIRMMSHEVNNSVGAANSLLQSSLHYKDQLTPEDRSDFEQAIRVVISRIAQLNEFMRGFADVVRLPPPRKQPCDVKEMLEGLFLLTQTEFRSKGIEWKWEITELPAPVPLDRVQMEQAFLNILKNAAEAMDGGGVITVRLGRKERRGFVVIEDTGCGISPEVRANLFTPFFSTKENGQGIGLTLVQEILTAHQFDFSLLGEAGKPTKFTVYF